MDEFECMRTINESLQQIADESARARVASWVASKYLGLTTASGASPKGVLKPADRNAAEGSPREGQVAGIAKLSQSGEVQLTVRDFKAKSANDAAVRLVHVLIWVTEKLTGATIVSSKHAAVPWLRKYRCYDGNTRGAIAKDKGLVRDGDDLSLDFHAEQLAEKYAAEILDPSVEGKWKRGPTRRRAPKPTSESSSDAQ